ncbi:DUF305 domain-containing protein [Gordonia sp. HY442]|uniref:DUF305 domain-containing protein n=1 Tax=Gordonia zhenghanii TaxID=2911516 RepID=UPI001F35CFCB|nr:DUF305 domain-containing protein [Gordonia zhenghanii]MCF8606977.1 DUF305 domain-containing protein [Gordonia zhenghanii]
MNIHPMTVRAMAAGAAAVTAIAVLGACSDSDDATNEGHGSTASMSMPASSGTQDQAAHNDADVMFAQMMIPHHRQAVQMSDILLAKDGVPDDVRELAESIKSAQAPEIQQLTGWLGAWGAPVEADMGGHHMDGMVSDADLAKLKSAPGEDAAHLYLQQMIGHHEGAVKMAQTEIDDGQNPDAVAMARSIVDTQNKEIHSMKDMLG